MHCGKAAAIRLILSLRAESIKHSSSIVTSSAQECLGVVSRRASNSAESILLPY